MAAAPFGETHPAEQPAAYGTEVHFGFDVALLARYAHGAHPTL